MIIDTHSHCYWHNLEPKIEEIIANMKSAGVERAVQIGCDIESSGQAISLANRYPETFLATVGLHPETSQNLDFTMENAIKILGEMEDLIVQNRDKIVAIGECGLDFHYIDGTDDGKKPADLENLSEKAKKQIENQKNWWMAQWELALKYDLPLIIHTRDARDATLEFIKEHDIYHLIMHCYSEDSEMAQELLDFSEDIYFSFSGILTYKNAQKVQETAKMLPIERILVETDAPFLAPQCVRGQVCEPAFTRFTLEKLAELREVSVDEIEDQIYENSKDFYNLK